MDAISKNAVNLGSLLSNVKAPIETVQTSDANVVSKVASVPLPKTNVRESSQEVRDAAESAMKDIQHFISSQARSVRISKDETSGHMIVQLVDPDTGEVIRTLPSEELLRLARSFEMLGNKMVHQVA
ncbi:MAG: flagellar protein FlaG [Burkholderiales bacterium]|jgi:flagellar protein FlaG|nr:flagellar protein FlaG [Burkholderiales bacterium]